MSRGYCIRAVGLAVIGLAVASGVRAQGVEVRPFVLSALVHGVPEPPRGGSWDSAFEFKGIAPDLFVCVYSPAYGVERCTAYCPDAYSCEQRFPGLQYGVPLDPRARSLNAQVFEYSPSGNRLVGEFIGIDPAACKPATPCTQVKPEGTLALSFGMHLVTVETAPPVPSTAPVATPPRPSATSWLDSANDWFGEQVWDRVTEAGGASMKFIEGLGKQGEAAETAYGRCLTGNIGALDLTPRYNAQCTALEGDARDACAARVLGENNANIVADCLVKETQVGLLMNLWKSACNVVGVSCD